MLPVAEESQNCAKHQVAGTIATTALIAVESDVAILFVLIGGCLLINSLAFFIGCKGVAEGFGRFGA